MAEVLLLGGREYVRVGMGTLEHDHWLAGHSRQAGSEAWILRPGESHEAFGARILADLMASGKAFLILGGLLMPKDAERWSREVAMTTAGEMAALTDPAEKRAANSELLSLVLDFFVNGLAFWMTSGTSSEKEVEPRESEEAASSASGEGSSEESREEITN